MNNTSSTVSLARAAAPYKHALGFLKNRSSRKVGNNTYARKTEAGEVIVRLHNTDILTFFPNGRVIVNTGGYRSNTTKSRINEFLPVDFPRLYQARGLWFWAQGDNSPIPFSDNDLLSSRGRVKTRAGKTEAQTRAARLTKQINAYADKCAQAVPLPMPSGGDDWFSALRTEDGKTLGEAFDNTEHLESNMRESYIVPSLVLRALEKAGAGDAIKAATFGRFPAFEGCARSIVKSAVRRYLKGRFKLAGGVY